MFSTFSHKDGSILIASKAWSDFGAHIPLIRSFSLGENFPPENPIFPGEPIRYHFLFYFLSGFLEKIGFRIDYALNLPSSISFFLLILIIYFLAKKLFKNKEVGFLTVIFFLFNGSFSFLEFFKKNALSFNTIREITSNSSFPSFGPYDGKIVSAFWNLNIYTNQRHLAGAYFLSFFFVFLLLKKLEEKEKNNLIFSLVIGFILGSSFFFHTAIFLINLIAIAGFFILFPKIRKSAFLILIIAGLIAFPQYLYMQQGNSKGTGILIHPGYLINQLTVLNFIKYWFLNFGLHFVLIPVGFMLANKNLKKIFLVFIPLFIIANFVQFSPDLAANHKFFNYFLIIGSMFSSFVLVLLWKKSLLLKPLVVVLFFFLTFSGIIDFFPILNDAKITLGDYPKNKDVKWIMENTPKDSLFLNASYLYNPASLAGRKIFMGWPYFPWSNGHDTNKRGKIIDKIYSQTNKESFCKLLKENLIDYFELSDKSDFSINKNLIDLFNPQYSNDIDLFYIFETKPNCKNV